jgi:NifU-like protein involved in Fe-S cluster formation
MIDADPRYSQEVLRRLRETPGAGDLAPGPAVAVGRAGDPEQGAEVELAFAVGQGKVLEARFRAYGCPHFIAGASWLTERLSRATCGELAAWDWRDAAEALDVPPAKFGRLLTLQDAVRAAARNWPGENRSAV